MTWRGSSTPLDRVFSCLVYLLPLMDAVLGFSSPFFNQFPQLQVVLLPLLPFLAVYRFLLGILSFGGLSLGGLLIFFALYFLVVRNEAIRHFLRFNTMQSILFGIVLSLFGLLLSVFPLPNLMMETLFNVAFLGIVAASIYSMVQSALGRYPEIPTVSEAVYMQVR